MLWFKEKACLQQSKTEKLIYNSTKFLKQGNLYIIPLNLDEKDQMIFIRKRGSEMKEWLDHEIVVFKCQVDARQCNRCDTKTSLSRMQPVLMQ